MHVWDLRYVHMIFTELPLPALISWQNLKSTTGELSSSSTCWRHKRTAQTLEGLRSTITVSSLQIASCMSCQHWKPFRKGVMQAWLGDSRTLCSCQMTIEHVRAVQKSWDTAWNGTMWFLDAYQLNTKGNIWKKKQNKKRSFKNSNENLMLIKVEMTWHFCCIKYVFKLL